MQELTSILEFDGVTLRASSVQTVGVTGVTFSLRRGEIALVEVEEGRENIPLAALAQGLFTPDSGKVYFNGECWEAVGPDRQSLMRGRIRRVFEHYGWVTNMDMMENLCLAESHNAGRELEEIQQEVRGLARRFGLDNVPEARPTRVHSMILRKLEWVRAFVGAPDLILLERPLAGAPKADAGKLIEAVVEAAKRGVAIIWISDENRVMECPEMAGVRRFRMDGDKMLDAGINKGITT